MRNVVNYEPDLFLLLLLFLLILRIIQIKVFYFGPRLPGVPLLVFDFLPAGSFLIFNGSDLRLADGVVDRTLKKPSKRPCVDVALVLRIFLKPPRMRSSLNCRSPHRNWTRPSSSGSVHLSYAYIKNGIVSTVKGEHSHEN